MIDTLLSLMLLFLLLCTCIGAMEASMRLRRYWFLRRTRRFAEQQEREWLRRYQPVKQEDRWP